MTALSINNLPLRSRIVFMGTPDFALPTLKALIVHGYDILAVVTQPDRPKGRGRRPAPPPVKELAVENNIEVLQPERISDEHFINIISKMEPDLIIVVAFGQILKKDLLDLPQWGVINIHASLLPKYRGAAPIQRAILNNESVTGLTIMHMDEGMDTGPILFQEDVPILKDETAGHLHDRLSLKAGDFIIDFLRKMAEEPMEERPQDNSDATYAPKIEKGLSLIDWGKPAIKVSALIRALDPWPGAHTTFEGERVKLFSAGVADEDRLDVVPGRAVFTEGRLHVETGKGVIKIGEMQSPGRKRLPVPDFLRGFSIPEGSILGE